MCACSEPSLTVIARPPADTAWIAAAWLSSSGEVLGATPLERWTGALPVRGQWSTSSPDAARVVLLGYTEASLSGLALPSAEMLGKEPLVAARATDPVLPRATWTAAGAVDGGEATVTEQAVELELTASWLPRCPVLVQSGERARVDIDCVQIFCDETVVQNDCVLSGHLEGCGLDLTRLEIDGRGHGSSGECAIVAPLDGTAAGVQCAECRIDLYVPPYPDRFVVEELPIIDVPETPGRLAYPPHGFLAGGARVGDRLAIVSHDGRDAMAPCTSTASTTVHLVDPDALAEVGRVPAPPCLWPIGEAVAHDAFYGVYGAGALRRLGRFDAAGHLVQSAALDGAPTSTHQPSSLVVTDDGRRVVVALSALADTARGQLQVFTAGTLAFERTIETEPHLYALLGTRASEVVVAVDPSSRLYFYDVAAGSTSVRVDLASGRPLVEKNGHFMGHLPGGERVYVSTLAEKGELHALTAESGWINTVETWELHGSPSALATWPRAPSTFFTVVMEAGTFEAHAALFDAEHLRYLPGTAAMGYGPALSILEDGRGRLFAVMPWSGKLARVTPR